MPRREEAVNTYVIILPRRFWLCPLLKSKDTSRVLTRYYFSALDKEKEYLFANLSTIVLL